MTAGDLNFENGVCFYQYRGKGGKTGRREFPQPALDALRGRACVRGPKTLNRSSERWHPVASWSPTTPYALES